MAKLTKEDLESFDIDEQTQMVVGRRPPKYLYTILFVSGLVCIHLLPALLSDDAEDLQLATSIRFVGWALILASPAISVWSRIRASSRPPVVCTRCKKPYEVLTIDPPSSSVDQPDMAGEIIRGPNHHIYMITQGRRGNAYAVKQQWLICAGCRRKVLPNPLEYIVLPGKGTPRDRVDLDIGKCKTAKVRKELEGKKFVFKEEAE